MNLFVFTNFFAQTGKDLKNLGDYAEAASTKWGLAEPGAVSYTHLTLPTNREV